MKTNGRLPAPGGPSGTPPPRPASVSRAASARRTRRRRYAVAALALLAAAAVLLAVVLSGREKPGGPSESSPTTAPTGSATSSGTAATAGTTAPPVTPAGALGADADHPVPLDLAHREEIPVPAAFREAGWELIRLLPDGRMILNSGRRLSVWDPRTGEETVVAEAEFGIQAAANDRFLAFGAGGDEMLEVSLHYIAENYTEVVLQDPDGYLDLEMTRAGGLLASRIRYTGEEAVLDAWLRFDTVSYGTSVLPSADRSYARYLFRLACPDRNPDWTYDIGKAWHEPWLDGAEQLFYAEIVRGGRDDYALRLFRSTASESDPVLFTRSGGPLPRVDVTQNLLVVDNSLAMHTATGRWVVADFAATEGGDFPFGGRLVAADDTGFLAAALDRYGRPTALYRLAPAG